MTSLVSGEKMLLNTDCPLDKVIYMKEVTVPLASLSFNDITITHDLGFTPLLQGAWTQDSTWATVYDENSGPVNAGGQFLVNTSVESTSTSIKLYNTNNQAFATNVYWRLFGFMPSNVNADAAFTSSSADNFVINTDVNYTKLYDSGVTAASSTLGSIETVDHNIGYKPQVLCWAENSTFTYWMNTYAQPGVNNNCKVTDTQIIFTRDNVFLSSAVKFHYKIYLDA